MIFLFFLILFNSYTEINEFELLRKKAQAEFKLLFPEVETLSCKERDEKINSFISKYGEENIYADYLVKFSSKRCIKDNKMGFCCDDGSVLIEPKFDYATSFYEGYALVRIGVNWGVIDTNGKIVVDISKKKDEAKEMADKLREDLVKNRLIYNHAVKLKKLIFEDWDLVKFVSGMGVGFLDKNGNIVVPIIYEDAIGFGMGDLAAVRKNGKWGFINRKNEVVIPFKYQDTHGFFERRAAVKINNKWGFIDEKGELVVKNVYEYVFSFNEMRAIVFKDGKYGFIDYYGNEIVEPYYDDITNFNSGISIATKDSKKYYIDRWGNKIEKIR